MKRHNFKAFRLAYGNCLKGYYDGVDIYYDFAKTVYLETGQNMLGKQI